MTQGILGSRGERFSAFGPADSRDGTPTYGGTPIQRAERSSTWPTLGAWIGALLDAQARLWKEASAWVS